MTKLLMIPEDFAPLAKSYTRTEIIKLVRRYHAAGLVSDESLAEVEAAYSAAVEEKP